ncbi:hypothetical protein CORC01_01952 [Colletotrichum orchidophilum]|uniref:Uncharacterized protein n=1 Tax=Colletotrichum orchidophilum TaxID=1209926 RepID=A0A1G4BN32_9PEZI|nr:uncharacterized protein CORC01_01952 [Colletotrichum orchidophilum]OHF02851.1 hypothetical protein CORC01_01952 [Colletotrichum orchidophilum]
MPGKVWSKEEERVYWRVIVPNSQKRVDGGIPMTWEELAPIMQTTMGLYAKRKYTHLGLLEHYFQNIEKNRISPNAAPYVRAQKMAIARAMKEKIKTQDDATTPSQHGQGQASFDKHTGETTDEENGDVFLEDTDGNDEDYVYDGDDDDDEDNDDNVLGIVRAVNQQNRIDHADSRPVERAPGQNPSLPHNLPAPLVDMGPHGNFVPGMVPQHTISAERSTIAARPARALMRNRDHRAHPYERPRLSQRGRQPPQELARLATQPRFQSQGYYDQGPRMQSHYGQNPRSEGYYDQGPSTHSYYGQNPYPQAYNDQGPNTHGYYDHGPRAEGYYDESPNIKSSGQSHNDQGYYDQGRNHQGYHANPAYNTGQHHYAPSMSYSGHQAIAGSHQYGQDPLYQSSPQSQQPPMGYSDYPVGHRFGSSLHSAVQNAMPRYSDPRASMSPDGSSAQSIYAPSFACVGHHSTIPDYIQRPSAAGPDQQQRSRRPSSASVRQYAAEDYHHQGAYEIHREEPEKELVQRHSSPSTSIRQNPTEYTHRQGGYMDSLEEPRDEGFRRQLFSRQHLAEHNNRQGAFMDSIDVPEDEF